MDSPLTQPPRRGARLHGYGQGIDFLKKALQFDGGEDAAHTAAVYKDLGFLYLQRNDPDKEELRAARNWPALARLSNGQCMRDLPLCSRFM